MYVYCADFQPSGDTWLSGPGTWEDISSANGSCTRSYVIVRADQFNDLLASSGSSPGSGASAPTSSFTADEISTLKYQAANPSPFNLSLEGGALVGTAILTTWAFAAGIRVVRSAFQGGDQSE